MFQSDKRDLCCQKADGWDRLQGRRSKGSPQAPVTGRPVIIQIRCLYRKNRRQRVSGHLLFAKVQIGMEPQVFHVVRVPEDRDAGKKQGGNIQ